MELLVCAGLRGLRGRGVGGRDDARLVANLLERAVFCIVPNMNPDGSQRGYTRTNALGANLNRYWVDPRPELAPETLMVKQAIEQTGIDFLLDVHAWAGTHNYAVGPHHIPSQTARQIALWQRYEAALAAADRHFQVGWPYPGGGPAPGQADLAMSWNYVSETWGALGLLYELMFKEDAQSPDPAEGWGPNKCRQFGRHTLEAIAAIVDDLG